MFMLVIVDSQKLVRPNFLSRKNGETTIENAGQLSDREIRIIRDFIKDNYKEMYMKWAEKSDNGFYGV